MIECEVFLLIVINELEKTRFRNSQITFEDCYENLQQREIKTNINRGTDRVTDGEGC
jgi:hypothetical protein